MPRTSSSVELWPRRCWLPLGSVLAFFLLNAGVIALVRPIEVPREVLTGPMLLFALTLAVVTVSMLRRSVPRLVGALLVGL